MAGWFAGSGCDTWVLRFTTVEPTEHSELSACSSTEGMAADLSAKLGEWQEYYRQQGIEAISDGVITLRKRSGTANWLRIDDTPQRIGPCGASVEAGFAAVDFLRAADP